LYSFGGEMGREQSAASIANSDRLTVSSQDERYATSAMTPVDTCFESGDTHLERQAL
jgi:hypothetical protein